MEVHRFKTREAEPWFAALAKTMLPDALAADDRPLAAPRLGRVRMYTFGAPRVGNSEFARFFDGLGMEAFRIVNGADIVARMPRHANSAGALLDYEHVGRTVLVEEDPSKLHKGFWVEGETAVEQCPLREVSPLSNPFSAGSVLGDLSQLTVGTLDKLGQKRLVSPLPCLGRHAYHRPCGILCVARVHACGFSLPVLTELWQDSITDRQQLAQAMAGAAAELERARLGVSKRLETASALDALSLFGLDKRFVESELKLIDSLRTGAALFHHLEPSYYKALTSGVDNWQGEEMAALARSLPEDQLEPVLLALRQAPHLQALLLRERERCLRDRLTQPQRPPEAAPGGGVDSDS